MVPACLAEEGVAVVRSDLCPSLWTIPAKYLCKQEQMQRGTLVLFDISLMLVLLSRITVGWWVPRLSIHGSRLMGKRAQDENEKNLFIRRTEGYYGNGLLNLEAFAQ